MEAKDTSNNHNKWGGSREGGVDSGSHRKLYSQGRFWGAHNLPGYNLGGGYIFRLSPPLSRLCPGRHNMLLWKFMLMSHHTTHQWYIPELKYLKCPFKCPWACNHKFFSKRSVFPTLNIGKTPLPGVKRPWRPFTPFSQGVSPHTATYSKSHRNNNYWIGIVFNYIIEI